MATIEGVGDQHIRKWTWSTRYPPRERGAYALITIMRRTQHRAELCRVVSLPNPCTLRWEMTLVDSVCDTADETEGQISVSNRERVNVYVETHIALQGKNKPK